MPGELSEHVGQKLKVTFVQEDEVEIVMLSGEEEEEEEEEKEAPPNGKFPAASRALHAIHTMLQPITYKCVSILTYTVRKQLNESRIPAQGNAPAAMHQQRRVFQHCSIWSNMDPCSLEKELSLPPTKEKQPMGTCMRTDTSLARCFSA